MRADGYAENDQGEIASGAIPGGIGTLQAGRDIPNTHHIPDLPPWY